MPELVLMPGLDGSGKLFAPLLAQIPEEIPTRVIRYPGGECLGYEALQPWLEERLPEQPYILVAESFSGPLALLHAARRPPRLHGLVLVATFCRNPAPWGLGPLLRCMGARIFAPRPPRLVLRNLLLDRSADAALLELTRHAADEQQPQVLAHRWRQILNLDLRAQLAELQLPCLYLQASRDRLVRGRSLRELRKVLPLLDVRQIDAPHLLLQRQPAAAWEAISAFTGESRYTPAPPHESTERDPP